MKSSPLFLASLALCSLAFTPSCALTKKFGKKDDEELRKAVFVADPKPEGKKKVASTSGGGAGSSAAVTRGLKNQGVSIPIALPPGVKVKYSSVSNVGGQFIAMTFDDGPHPTNTPKLLDMLKARNIRATFFVVGTNAKRYPALLRRMVAEGHEIGNHTVTHITLTRASDAGVLSELQGCHDAILSATGVAPRVMRPPGGASNDRVRALAYNNFGYPTIMWSVDPEDWKRPGVGVVTSRLVNGASSGGILLAHDIHAPTITAMPDTLDRLLSKGYRFVTVSQLISMGSNTQASHESGAGEEGEGEVAAVADPFTPAADAAEDAALAKVADEMIEAAEAAEEIRKAEVVALPGEKESGGKVAFVPAE